MQDFAGKVAVVTGGASGIGLGLATRFAAEGMRLVLADIEDGALEAAAQGLRESGAEVLAVQTDAGDAASMDNLGERTLDHYGAVHIVCNNAGVGTHGRMWELSVNDWEFVLRVNLWGVIHGVRVFAPHLIEQDEGHIVNTASMAGLVSVAGAGPYNVSKHGAVTLSETLSAELRDAGSNVGVSVLCPGLVATNLGASERNRPADLRELDAEEIRGASGAGTGLLPAWTHAEAHTRLGGGVRAGGDQGGPLLHPHARGPRGADRAAHAQHPRGRHARHRPLHRLRRRRAQAVAGGLTSYGQAGSSGPARRGCSRARSRCCGSTTASAASATCTR